MHQYVKYFFMYINSRKAHHLNRCGLPNQLKPVHENSRYLLLLTMKDRWGLDGKFVAYVWPVLIQSSASCVKSPP